jgi:hypothetical protein
MLAKPAWGAGGFTPLHGTLLDMKTGSVSRTIIDDTLPGGPVERTITNEAPFDRCDRVGDYRIVWGYFEKQEGNTP